MTDTTKWEGLVSEPGLYDMAPDRYHSDPVPGGSLSHTGAIRLLPPHCPAHYRYWADHPAPPNQDYDIGRVAHHLVLGGVDAIAVIAHDDWRTKEAQRQRKEAYAAGRTPLLQGRWQEVQDMAEALWRHPVASALLRGGRPEQSIFWRTNGIWRRMRTDFLPTRSPEDMYVVEYKTARSAHPAAAAKAMWEYRYMQQLDWYQTGIRAMGHTTPTGPYLIFQEKTPPYLISVVEPDRDALEWGRELNTTALGIYQQCKSSGRWPGYPTGPVRVSLPVYAEYQLTENLLRCMEGEL